MTRKIGIIYSSVDGQTEKICKKLGSLLKKEKIRAELYSIDNFNLDITKFETIIIGASIRYGKHNSKISEFIFKNKDSLSKKKTAFFSVNLVARKKDKNLAETNPYVIKFLKTNAWKPNFVDVFAGKLDYKSYSLIDRIMIKLIMKLTNGPTKSDTSIEFTDWKRVVEFGLRISENHKSTKHNSVSYRK